jgi:hypothetical protein
MASWLWLNGWGVLAVAYHIFHNFLVVAPQVFLRALSGSAQSSSYPGQVELALRKSYQRTLFMFTVHMGSGAPGT